jgi:exopolysaccharide biosynthesis polyprenyl glycosylphosphotransferase
MPETTGAPKQVRQVAIPNPDNARTRPLLALPNLREVKSRRARRTRMALIMGRVAADSALLLLAFVVAYWLRYGLELGRDVVAPESFLPISSFYPYILAYTALTLITFYVRGLYALPRGAAWFDHVRIIASASLVGVSAMTLGALLLNPVLPSRLVFIYLWLSTLAIFAVERFLYRQLRMWLWRRGINIRNALVIGASVAGQRIMKDILERPELGYKLAGYVADTSDTPGSPNWRVPIRTRNGNGGPQRLGSLKDVQRLISRQDLHEVIVALPATHHAQILGIIDNCRESGVDFKLVPDLFEMRFNEVRIDALNGVPLIGVKDVALHGFNLFVKRALDIIMALGALIVAAIPMLIIAAVIKTTSPGPVLFKQKRVGKGGHTFTCLKFRSMYRDAEERLEELRHLSETDGPTFKMRDDPRLTPFGKRLRRTSLDELPQLFNILRGDMSWVGPRPPTPSEVARYSDWHHKRLDITPGLTGLWQVSGRSELSFDEMVKLDLYYAENWSLAVDVMILLRTIPAVLKREGAF